MADFFQFIQNHLILSIAFVAILLLLVWEEWRNKGYTQHRISPKTLVDLMNHKHAKVLDIRSQKAYKESHIIHSSHIDASSIEQQVKKLAKYKNDPLVVVDQKGEASGEVVKKLKKLEFNDVYVLVGGITAWEHAGLPVKKAKS
jgi:rhodanese-related sulfurtransferase